MTSAAVIISIVVFFLLGWVFGYIARNAVARKPASIVAARRAAPKAAPKPPARRSPAKKTTRSSGKDDLKLISGIGPTIEKKLHKMGVTKFGQIAQWNKADIDKADAELNFKGRITREKWVAQAKTLAAGGETAFSKKKK